MKKILSKIGIMMIVVMVITANLIPVSTMAETVSSTPKYVFYFIGDGLGAAQRQVAEFYLREVTGDDSAKLVMNQFPVAGINSTYSSNTLVTDSAAAGTALATGYKSYNGAISVLDDRVTKVKTLVEAAEEKGIATGIVSTTYITHATPSVFMAHNEDRNNNNDLAVDFMDSGVDYIAGGGTRHFLPQNWVDDQKDAMGGTIKSSRTDDRNLMAEFAQEGYKTFYGTIGADEFDSYAPKAGDEVLALFTHSHLPYEVDRTNTENNCPSLAEITAKGIDLLSQDPDGFFMMVEGGRIDHACHANDAKGAIMDTLAFDDAIKEAYDFYQVHPEETLIVVVGDHETGGMGLGFASNYFLNMDQLVAQKVSVEDVLQKVYSGDRAAMYKYLEENMGISNLTEEEKAELEKAMDIVDSGKSDSSYGGYEPVSIAATHILAERANLQWTTYAHSGTAIPCSALGVGADKFGGYKDNTEIAQAMSALLGFTLGPIK